MKSLPQRAELSTFNLQRPTAWFNIYRLCLGQAGIASFPEMKLKHGLHLAYCTNIHRGESWSETFDALQRYTLAVKEKVCPGGAYAIGLRLSERAARELQERELLRKFKGWLREHDCYVFTINGFPFGAFHGTRVKEQVYLPDWTSEERVAYTLRLAELLSELLLEGVDGSISTVPLGFKPLVKTAAQQAMIRKNLWRTVEGLAELEERTGRYIHVGLEPEPGCVLETTGETIEFFDQMRSEHPGDERLQKYLGVNYDTCHLAVEFEDAREGLESLVSNGIKISKLHLSSALKVKPTREVREALKGFVEPVYLHQVIARAPETGGDRASQREARYLAGERRQYTDLDEALANEPLAKESEPGEWRIHFHVPLHSAPTALFGTTSEHLLETLDWLKENPNLCSHLEMETYTWEVLPGTLKSRSVVEQLAAEYGWTLKELGERGLA